MPDGKTHNQYFRLGILPVITSSTIACGIVGAWLYKDGGIWLASYSIEFWFWLNIWYLAGHYVSPDWDLIGVTADEGRLLREGGLFGAFLFGYSSFYAALMNYFSRVFRIKGIAGAHRSWLTHSPIGTLIRAFFLDMPLVYVYNLVQASLRFLGSTFQFAPSDVTIFLLAQIVGLGIADGIHVILDHTYGESYGRETDS